MSASPHEDLGSRALLLDIEGTTTSISFVYEVLFPFARAHTMSYLERNYASPEVQSDLEGLRAEHAADVQKGLNPPELRDSPPDQLESLVRYIHWLMDQDRKATPLKSLQGKIWEDGYRSGELESHVYEDVPVAFERWQRQGIDIFIYSSGSVFAQKLLFEHTLAGDLTGFINGYFDTQAGAKTEAGSYEWIAAELNRPPSRIVFISDVVRELDPAADAGMVALMAVRPGNRPQPGASHRVIHTFDEVFP